MTETLSSCDKEFFLYAEACHSVYIATSGSIEFRDKTLITYLIFYYLAY